ncbi:hypothetical protein [Nocardia puris]|uniref:hypothetical protein n=1 Tax=Nocardia puris TaxID=208602 RepID=UPI0018DCDD79|nr:hypothetical protein [Nocardia puris]
MSSATVTTDISFLSTGGIDHRAGSAFHSSDPSISTAAKRADLDLYDFLTLTAAALTTFAAPAASPVTPRISSTNRQVRAPRRQELVRDPSTRPHRRLTRTSRVPIAGTAGGRRVMSVVVFTALTVALFALLGLIQRGVEKL